VTDALRVAIIGDKQPGFVPQEAIETALNHAAARQDVRVETTWHATPILESKTEARLQHADAIWCAPGGPYLSLDGALNGIRYAREHNIPFLGTCAGFQHAVIEFARNVLGEEEALHPEYAEGSSPLFLDDALCSRVGEEMKLRITDPQTQTIYGADHAVETYYCRFALRDEYVPKFEANGLTVAGVDHGTRIMRVAGHPFFYLTLFVPQVASSAEHPHPLIKAYVTAAHTA
jgi:CTP synthase (UTP-ammonia lyase)